MRALAKYQIGFRRSSFCTLRFLTFRISFGYDHDMPGTGMATDPSTVTGSGTRNTKLGPFVLAATKNYMNIRMCVPGQKHVSGEYCNWVCFLSHYGYSFFRTVEAEFGERSTVNSI